MNRFEHFRELREDLSILLGGVVSSVAHAQLFTRTAEEQHRTLACLIARHPFLDMCYLLDAQGRQVGDSVVATRRRVAHGGDAIDRSHRPYYLLARDAKEAILTSPYLSSATGNVCVTAAAPVGDETGRLLGLVVADSKLDRALSLLEEDDIRRGFEPFFKFFYVLFSLGLLTVSMALGGGTPCFP